MRVLFLCNLIPNKIGAFETWLVRLAQFFREQGDELRLAFAREPIPDLAGRLRQAGAEWETIPAWSEGEGRERAWGVVGPARRLVARCRPDVAVIHFGNELPAIALRLAAAAAGARRTKWIWQQHQEIRDPSSVTRHLSQIRLLGLFFHHLSAVYEGGRRSLVLRGVPDRKVTAISNAIEDLPRRRPAGWLRPELGLPAGAAVIANVGWLVPRKRIDFILRALAAAAPRCRQPVHLVLVGQGPERAALERLAGELGLSGTVHFLGLRNDVREVLFEADLLAHSALAETCTYAVTESMACGIPAVVTEAGACREQITDGESGCVVGRDDHAGFADRLVALLDGAEGRRRMGAAARARFEARYRIEDSVRSYHALYRRVAGARQPLPEKRR